MIVGVGTKILEKVVAETMKTLDDDTVVKSVDGVKQTRDIVDYIGKDILKIDRGFVLHRVVEVFIKTCSTRVTLGPQILFSISRQEDLSSTSVLERSMINLYFISISLLFLQVLFRVVGYITVLKQCNSIYRALPELYILNYKIYFLNI